MILIASQLGATSRLVVERLEKVSFEFNATEAIKIRNAIASRIDDANRIMNDAARMVFSLPTEKAK